MDQVVNCQALPWRPQFSPGPVRVKFVVDEVALGQVFL